MALLGTFPLPAGSRTGFPSMNIQKNLAVESQGNHAVSKLLKRALFSNSGHYACALDDKIEEKDEGLY